MAMVIEVSINPIQSKILKSRAKNIGVVGGRGSGKSMGMGLKIKQLFEVFPRATWCIAGLTYLQIDSVVIPNLRDALLKHGIHEYDPIARPFGLYVVGVQPPKHWIKPYKEPGRGIFKYCITFINGFTLRLVSQDNAETHRGLSINGILLDEAAIINYNFIQTVLKPALRGNVMAKYESHPMNYGFFYFTSASWTIEGNWIYDIEEKYLAMLDERRKKLEQYGPQYLIDNPPNYLFLESTFRDNQKFLPADFGTRLKEDMEPWKYAVEVENQRIMQLPNTYYHAFGEHNLYFKSYDYGYTDAGVLVPSPNDFSKDKPLEITLDFNTDIVWCLVCQTFGNEFRVVNSGYKKPSVVQKEQETSILLQLAKWFVDEYSDNKTKEVFIYGDPNGNSTNAATDGSNKPFLDKFSDFLIKNGWKVYRKESYRYPPRKERYELMNLLLAGTNDRLPKIKINKTKCKDFIIAIQNTLVTTDKQFKKDKRSEKKARFREHATDSTDAFDYICYTKYGHLIGSRRGFRHQ